MFDLVHKYRRITQVVLALIALPFAFFGVDYYFRRGDMIPEVAQVSGQKITQAEFENAMRDQQERLRQQLGPNVDPAMLDTPELRFTLLERLVTERLLQDKARREAIRVADGQLQQVIGSIPAFQVGGNFSIERYKEVLSGQSMSQLQFEDRMRQQLLLGPLQDPVANAGIVARPSAARYLDLLDQQREAAVTSLEIDPLAKGIEVGDGEVKTHFDANTRLYQVPEQVRFEYLIVTLDSLMAGVTVDAAELKAQYEQTTRQWAQEEQRSAAHVLITVKPDAPEADKAAAKKKAEEVAAEARATPARFAELAKKYSQDPGSSGQGGDLGSFTRGNMVKSFDDAVFAMKVGEIAGPVLSEFGYHVIRLNAIIPAKIRPFDEVRTQLESDLRRQKGQQKFATIADQLQNLVYEQADTLDGAAKTLGVPVATSPWATRTQVQALAMGNPRFVDALFSPESIQSRRNTEAIEIAPTAVMAGRVVDYKATTPRAYEEVKEEIRRELARRVASEQAQKNGQQKLALLADGKSEKDAGLQFQPPQMVKRTAGAPGFTPEALRKIFAVDPARLPAYVGTTNERGGFSIYRVSKVIAPPPADDAKFAETSARMQDQLGRELMTAYVAAMRSKADVTINQANLDKK